ncbi:MAG: hypothetical protein FD126_1958 [Elusimicrobia bacterium]|nr:MAG: hypothetical protein FD126_1958 [Elusimicrobiota bacterium]
MKTAALAFVLLGLVPSAHAVLKTPTFTPPAVVAANSDELESPYQVLRVQVEGEYAGIKHSADFLVENANQSNYVQGGEKAFSVETKAGKGLEFKKWGFIVNVLPVVDPNKPERVNLQMQVEISGPVQGKEGVEVQTWQLQTSIHVTKGKPKTVARGSGKFVVTVTEDVDGD